MLKKILCLFIIITTPFLLIACGSGGSPINGNGGGLKIVTSLFPQYDFARIIAGDRAEVKLLLPPGTESHTFELSPRDMKNVYDADLFIYTGEYMEPWAGTVIAGITGGKPRVVDASAGVNMIEDDDGDHPFDPHIWLDPTIAAQMADAITEALCDVDPGNQDFYRANRDAYKRELEKLDDDFKAMIESSKRRTLVFGERFAYIYFLRRYGLDYQTAYEGCSTDNEPSAATIKRIIDYINENETPCIYYAELTEPRLARSIAAQTGIACELFSTGHNVTKDELESGITYIDIMRANLEAVRKGLN